MHISCPCVNWQICQTGICVCVYGCLADEPAENYSCWHATNKSFICLCTSSQLDFRPVVFQTVMWFYLRKINSRLIHLWIEEPESHAPLASGGSVLLPIFGSVNFGSLQQFGNVLVYYVGCTMDLAYLPTSFILIHLVPSSMTIIMCLA